MFPKLPATWHKMLSPEFDKPYFIDLQNKVEYEYETHNCYPSIQSIFAAFDYCTFEDLKVVIIGQDPYHGFGEANGLCFSVNDGIKIPPSLRNIFKEINTDLDTVFFPTSGNLERWAKQGILLLNNSLSVKKDAPNSHKHLAWSVFTDAVIQSISDQKTEVVFLLWGAFAQKKGINIDTSKHLVLQSAHPSPMSASRGKWFGNKHFSQTNTYLKQKGKTEIEW